MDKRIKIKITKKFPDVIPRKKICETKPQITPGTYTVSGIRIIFSCLLKQGNLTLSKLKRDFLHNH